ncbi:17767_t:CDS:1, partial [Cetraspora pellucida]
FSIKKNIYIVETQNFVSVTVKISRLTQNITTVPEKLGKTA